jgi:hypothetical protein
MADRRSLESYRYATAWTGNASKGDQSFHSAMLKPAIFDGHAQGFSGYAGSQFPLHRQPSCPTAEPELTRA